MPGTDRHLEPSRPEEKARDLLDRWPLELPMSIATVAGEVGLHPSHLARIFRRRWGRSMSEYVLELRVERAGRLLAGGVSPSESAFAVGFFDQSHLTRAFRRFLGTTPGRYRARWGRDARSVQDVESARR